jgi:transcriptional regulator with XRE-family HTH domain
MTVPESQRERTVRAMREIGARLRRARESRGLTSDAMAEAANVSSADIERIESGYTDMCVSELFPLLAGLTALGIPFAEVFG